MICIAAVLFLPATSSAAAAQQTRQAGESASADSFLLAASLDPVTGETHLKDHSLPEQHPNADQPQEIITRIEFIGNRRIRTDTLKARIFSRDGDAYNEETLKRDFQALWNTQFFSDIKLLVENSPDRANAKIVFFEVKERPVIRRIRYDGLHSASESDILERFKQEKVGLTVESPFDPTRIKKAEVVLKQLEGEHGRQFATVNAEYENIASSNAVILIFKVSEGPKVKVGQIKFTGNHAFSDRKLIRVMRNDRPYAIPLYFYYIDVMSKTYDRRKLSEDMEVGIRGLYQDNGYFKVVVAEPILENVDSGGSGFAIPGLGSHSGKAVNITIPIDEGEQYHMGTLKIVSSDPDKALSLKVDALKSIFPLKPGDIFAANKARKALEDYGKVYGEYGFIDFTAEPQFDIDDASKIISLTLRFDEQKQYYVRRINFSGNTTTRDKVIRRELLIDEGQLFNKRAWEVSILRLNQLGYFDRIEADKAAEIKRNTKEGTVDITLKLKERGKQSIGLNGGVSGLSGGFIGLTYQTNNFLGLGETLTFNAQIGSLARTIMFGFTEPYLLDRPISTGFTIFSSLYKYNQARQAALQYGQPVSINPQYAQNYNQNSNGFTLTASYPLRRYSFTRVGLTYGLTHTNITTFNEASNLLFTQLQYRAIAGPNALNGIVSSAITPTITYNTVNNPINATSGKSIFYSFSFQGGPLGGNVNSITNTLAYKAFYPINKRRNAIGFNLQVATVTGFGGKEVPPYSRFYMGGENDIRGFDIRSISPVAYIPTIVNQQVRVCVNNQLGGGGTCTPGSFNVPVLIYASTLPGADLEGWGNFEYRIPIAGPVSMSLFADVGTDGIVKTSGLKLDLTGVTNINNQFPDVHQTQQLLIGSGTNFHLRMSTGVEFIVNLPIVQAPFRIYYAYNPFRVHQQVVSPFSQVNLQSLQDTCATFGLNKDVCLNQALAQVQYLLQNPGRLNYFDPKSTFRFTVSRTF